MAISFDQVFDKVRECFLEESVVNSLVPKLRSITIIRDVQGKIRLFLEPLDSLRSNDIEINILENFFI